MCKAHLIKQTDQNIKLLLFDSVCTKLIMNLKAEVNWVNRDPCRQFRETLFFFQLDKNTVFCTLILFSNLNELSDWVEIRLLLLGVVQNNLILHSKKTFFCICLDEPVLCPGYWRHVSSCLFLRTQSLCSAALMHSKYNRNLITWCFDLLWRWVMRCIAIPQWAVFSQGLS